MRHLPRIGYPRHVILILALASCSPDLRPLDERLHDALAERLEQYDVKGASVAVMLPNGTLHRVVAGFSHDSVAMHPDMLFATGSITKNFVAALVLRLAEEGLLSLEDSLHTWLPSYPHIDSAITIRQLLGHTSGLFMFWENQKLWDDLIAYRDSIFTPEIVLTYLGKPHFAPGNGFRYSNTNYLLLAMIATKATRSTLAAELRQRFWEPVGLRNTFLSMEDSIPQERLAHAWGDNFEKEGLVRDITFLPRASHESITYGSSGVFTTAGELATWCDALFRGKVLRSGSLKNMLTMNRDAASSWCESYGLGVFMLKKKTTNGERAYGHGGGNIGTSASMVYLPDHKASIVVMINAFHGSCPGHILEDCIEIVVEELERKALFHSERP